MAEPYRIPKQTDDHGVGDLDCPELDVARSCSIVPAFGPAPKQELPPPPSEPPLILLRSFDPFWEPENKSWVGRILAIIKGDEDERYVLAIAVLTLLLALGLAATVSWNSHLKARSSKASLVRASTDAQVPQTISAPESSLPPNVPPPEQDPANAGTAGSAADMDAPPPEPDNTQKRGELLAAVAESKPLRPVMTIRPATDRPRPEELSLDAVVPVEVAAGAEVETPQLAGVVPASPMLERPEVHKFTDQEIATILTHPPQVQAEELLQAAVNHYEGAPKLIESHVNEWRGKVKWTQHLVELDTAARFSNDLSVRAATTELMLAVYNYPKTSKTVDRLVHLARENPPYRAHAMDALSRLGNRGVDTARVIKVLQQYAGDSEDKTQRWAIEGIARVGTPEAIPILLQFLDGGTRSQQEYAERGLASSGKFGYQERTTAVPKLIEYVERPDVDHESRRLHFQALRGITSIGLPDDPTVWRRWLGEGGMR